MLYESDFLAWLRGNVRLQTMFGSKIYWQLAPQKTTGSFLVLQGINTRGHREVDAASPRMQLDCFSTDASGVVELAEAVVQELFGRSFIFGSTAFSCMVAERAMVIPVEDRSFKVPVDVRFSCRRNA